jgi:hypothetical protein
MTASQHARFGHGRRKQARHRRMCCTCIWGGPACLDDFLYSKYHLLRYHLLQTYIDPSSSFPRLQSDGYRIASPLAPGTEKLEVISKEISPCCRVVDSCKRRESHGRQSGKREPPHPKSPHLRLSILLPHHFLIHTPHLLPPSLSSTLAPRLYASSTLGYIHLFTCSPGRRPKNLG